MNMEEYKQACLSCSVPFERIVSYLKEEMEKKSFTTDEEDYKVLKIKYNYLTELSNLIDSEQFTHDGENNNDD